MVQYPPDESQEECAICDEPFEHYDSEFASHYVNLVCEACDSRAVTEDGTQVMRSSPNVGDNPVFIDGEKCWRRYRFGGWITRHDEYDCDTMEEFYEKHRDDF